MSSMPSTMSFFRIALTFSAICSISGFTPLSPHHLSRTILHESSTTFGLKEYLASKTPAIELAIEKSIKSDTKETEKICESMKYSMEAGGKRIRPVLCIAACEMFGGNMETAMPCAVSLEMIHTMSLIHDDLPSMDNDDLRRGVPTNHVLYGEDVAILAGDALLSTAFEHVARETKNCPPEKVLDIVTRLGKSVGPVGLAGGQVMDLECEGKADVSLDELSWIHTHKTAALLQVSVACGAILGGASSDDVERCEKFALNIGLAFQVADDILDVTASTEELGKTAGKDEDTDKTTYPKLLGLEASKREAERLVNEAKACLEPYGERAAPLLGIADYIISRKN